jgi:moderate conductance mechanosensitive channel
MLPILLAQAAQTDGQVVVELTGCEDTQSALCDLVLEVTGSQTAADAVYLVVGKPLRIVLVLVIAWLLTRLVRRGGRRIAGWFVNAAEKKAEVAGKELAPEARERVEVKAETVRRVARSLAVVLIWSVALLLILAEIGVNLFPLLAAAGVAGLAVGLGAQSLVKDYVNGLFMLAEGQLGVGDEVDLGEAEGFVVDVTLRVTTIRADDGSLWYVPNGQIASVANKSQAWSRAHVDVRVSLDADIPRVKEIVRGVAEGLRADPAWAPSFLEDIVGPFVFELGPDAVVVRVSLRVRRESTRPLERELRERVKRALEEAGVPLQLPQQAVRLLQPSPG